jgi:hypothetical protein
MTGKRCRICYGPLPRWQRKLDHDDCKQTALDWLFRDYGEDRDGERVACQHVLQAYLEWLERGGEPSPYERITSAPPGSNLLGHWHHWHHDHDHDRKPA